jgi:hypothetical protein
MGARGLACAAAAGIAVAACTPAISGSVDGGPDEDGGRAERFGLSIMPPAARICPGDCVQLDAQAGGGHAPYTYRWDGVDSGSSALTVCPSATTKYTVTADDGSGAPATAHATVTVDPDCHGPPPPMPQAAPLPEGGVFSGNACVDPPTDPWTGCVEIVFGDEDASPGTEATACDPTNGADAVSLCLPRAILAGQQYELHATYEVKNAFGPVPLSGVAGARDTCGGDQWLIYPSPWPIRGTPYSGTFTQDSCLTAGEDLRQLVYETIPQPFLSVESLTVTFDLCSGCGPSL